jgi:hypothetical protein
MILAAGMVAAASPAAAVEFEKKSWEVGAYLVSSTYDNDSTISDTFAWGVRGGFIGAPRHEAEFTFEMQTADDATKGSDATYDITKWTINYVYNTKVKKPESKLAPLLIFGAGTMSYQGGGESESSTILQAGGGVRIFFTKKFAMRIDGKIWHFHGDGSGGDTGVPRDGFFAFDATVGVSYVFGGGA